MSSFLCANCGYSVVRMKPSDKRRFCSQACFQAHKATVPSERYFWPKVSVSAPDDCWPWTGATKPNGYGAFNPRGNPTGYAHRWAFTFRNGPIPDGMLVCHSCDNRRCCNPAHLWLGTVQDNADDMVRKGRWAKHERPFGERNGLTTISATDAAAIYMAEGRTKDIAARFGVHRNTVYNIKSRRLRWREIAAILRESGFHAERAE